MSRRMLHLSTGIRGSSMAASYSQEQDHVWDHLRW